MLEYTANVPRIVKPDDPIDLDVKVKKVVEKFKILDQWTVIHTKFKCLNCDHTQEVLDHHMNPYCPVCGKLLWEEVEE